MSSFKGNIYWDGERSLIKGKDKFIEWLKQFPQDQWFDFEVSPIGGVEESNQKKLYFKWRDILAAELGWTQTDMHEYLKERFNGGKSTKTLDTKGWSQMMTQVLAFAGEHNITLPTGNSE